MDDSKERRARLIETVNKFSDMKFGRGVEWAATQICRMSAPLNKAGVMIVLEMLLRNETEEGKRG